MIQIQNKKDCCGCEACASICPIHCIEMKKDEEGFAYPFVESEKCINCGSCENVCPVKKDKPYGSVKEAYVVQDKRNDVRESSSSGGAFTAIAEYVIAQGGTVYGAAYDNNYYVYHVGVKKSEGLKKFRGSKYVQSAVTGVYAEIKGHLMNNEWVLFSGTPCQVAGLKSYLKKEWDKLVTIDIACHGVPSPKLWKKYLDWWREYKKCNINYVEFRSKKYGYSGSTMRLVFEDGSEYSREPLLQFYKNTMFAGLSMRPSCHECYFKSAVRASDFTIFDCWDVNIFCQEMDDDRGTTALLIQTDKARAILPEISKNWKIYSVDAERLIYSDGDMITKNAPADPRRGTFFRDADSLSLSDLNKKYFPLTVKKRLIYALKPLLYRLGILRKIKRRISAKASNGHTQK